MSFPSACRRPSFPLRSTARRCWWFEHPDQGDDALPFGPFDPLRHRTLDSGLRAWVGEQTQLSARLCRAALHLRRSRPPRSEDRRRPARGLGRLSRADAGEFEAAPDTLWRDWYRFFPWEDWRDEKPAVIGSNHRARPWRAFVKAAPDKAQAEQRRDRARLCFGLDGLTWDEEKALERYELSTKRASWQEAARDGESPHPRLVLGCGMMVQPSPHPRHHHRAAARQDEIPPGGVRVDAAVLHAAGFAAHCGGDFGRPPAQTEFPPAGRGPRASGRHR